MPLIKNAISIIAIVVCICLLITHEDVQAQSYPYRFHYLTVDEGLSHTDATDLVQDKQGYIWIATLFGLDRFDGYTIRKFYNSNAPLYNAYRNRIYALAADDADRIWLGTEDGVQCFDTHTEQFTSYRMTGYDSTGDFTKLIIGPNKTLLAVSDKGTVTYGRISGNQITAIPFVLPPGIKPSDVTINTTGEIFLASNNGIWQLNNGHLYRQQTTGDSTSNSFSGIYCSKNGDLLTWERNKLFLYHKENKQTVSYILSATYFCPTSHICDIVQDSAGNYWLNTVNKLIEVDKTLHFVQEIVGRGPAGGLNSSALTKLYIDRSQCLWVGSCGGGVNYCDLNEKKFYTLQHIPGVPNSLSGNYVRSVLDENGKDLWIGTRYNGLNHYDLQTQQLVAHYGTQDGIPIHDDAISALLTDNDHNLWIGTYSGLAILRPDRRHYWHPPGYEHFPAHVLDAMAKDCFGNIWFGDHNHKFGVIWKDASGTFQVKYYCESYFILADDKKPELFISNTCGLHRLIIDKEGNILKTYNYRASSKPNSLSSNYTYPICKQNDSTYWIGTIGGGLNRLVVRTDDSYSITTFTDVHGMFNDVESLEIDDAGHIWLGGNGLQCFDPATKHLLSYNKTDGLQGNSFKVNASSKGFGGRLFFGGINGLNYFSPAEIKSSPIPAQPVLTGLWINNELLTASPCFLSRRQRQFNYQHNNITISFSAMHYPNPLKCLYRYRLEGYDKNWHYTDGNNPVAVYNNLNYDDYQFVLEATNSDGKWSSSQAKIALSVIPPWWKSVPAKTIYILLFIALLFGIYIYQARWYRLKNELALRKVSEQQREAIHEQREQFYQQQLNMFTFISHEFRTPLTLLHGLVERLTANDLHPDRKSSYGMMQRNVKRLINMVSELMNFKKVADGAVRLQVQELSISGFCNSLYPDFESLAGSKNISFQLTDHSILANGQETTSYFDMQVLEKILFNLLNNAFKYTNHGGQVKLEIFFDRQQYQPSFDTAFHLPNTQYQATRYIYILVADTGIGIAKDAINNIFDCYYRISNHHLGSGIGLALVKSLVQLHKGNISVYSERHKGTEFLVALPWGKEHYSDQEIMPSGTTPAAPQLEHLDNSTLQPLSPVPPPTRPAHITAKSRCILLVEDNTELRTFLRESLEPYYQILEAGDGESAITIARQYNPDLIVSDVMMPGMSGIELCRELKNNLDTSHIPFIILSAKDATDSKINGLESGADYYFAKPLSMELLRLTIHNALEQLQKLKQRYNNDYLSAATELVRSEKDKDFISTLVKLIEDNMQNPDLDVDFLCTRLNTSRTKLYQKIKSISDQSVGEFIKTVRLKKAIYLMTHEDITLNEVADRIGLQSSSYFSRMFKKEYKTSPSEYIRLLRKNAAAS